MTRRAALGSLAAGAAISFAGQSIAATQDSPLTVAAQSPRFLANGVAMTSEGVMFVSLPRWTGMETTPSVARVAADGTLVPFPGGAWNEWSAGKDPADAFVQINALHVFGDDTLWVLDQGAPDRKTTLPGAQKLLQFDTRDGKLLRALRFGTDILPNGAQLNDLRIWGSRIYATDSGLGGIIVHDVTTGKTLRRLSQNESMQQAADMPMRGSGGRVLQDAAGKSSAVNADMIEISPDGRWLYVSAPTGPMRRVPTALLDDASVSETQLIPAVEEVASIPTLNGTAMDTLGNLYLGDAEHRRIEVMAPSGKRAVLVADDRLVNPDALFIDRQRRLYVPATQNERMPDHDGGRDTVQRPFMIFAMPLPDTIDGIRLGNAIAPILAKENSGPGH